MEWSFFLAVAMFAFITSVTPGPNNMMLLASGAQFGFRQTLPHMLGIIMGMALLLTSVLAGLGVLFSTFPVMYTVLKVLGSVYLLWLAWKIGSAPIQASSSEPVQTKRHPMRWWQAALFQFVNPKAWMMSIGCVSSFSLAGDAYVLSGLWIIILFALMGLPAISLWAGLGVWIRQLLTNATRQRLFNYTMGLLTAATLLLIVNQ